MKYLVIIFLLLLSGCSLEYHIGKAKSKGFQCSQETIIKRVPIIDTVRDEITNEIISLDTMYIEKIKIIEKPIYLRMSRQERLAIRDSMRHIENLKDAEIARLENELKQKQRTERLFLRRFFNNQNVSARQEGRTSRQWSKWYIWLIIGFGVGLLARFL